MAIAAHKDNHALKAALRNLIEKLSTARQKAEKKAKAKAEKTRIER